MINNYNIQLSSIKTDYKQATIYYAQLKNKFLNQVTKNLSTRTSQEFLKARNQIEAEILSAGEKHGFNEHSKILNDILNSFGEYLIDDHANFVKKSQSKIADMKRNKAIRVQQQKDLLKQQILKNTNESQLKTILNMAISDVVGTNNTIERFDALINKVNSFLNVWVSSTIGGNSIHKFYGILAATLGGYVAEDLEYQALDQYFSQMGMKVVPGGTKKANGQMTEFDNIISTIEYLPELFENQINATTNILGQDYFSDTELIKKINYFGEQVKSFDLSKGHVTRAGLAGYEISSNEGLANTARNENVYSIKSNIAFLGRYANIIKTFGPATVLFSSAGGRQWMSDFISDFRKQQYYLMFRYDGPRISNTIILDKPLGKRGLYKSYRSVAFD